MQRPVLLFVIISLLVTAGCDSPESLHSRAAQALEEDRPADAIRYLEKATRVWPNEPELHYALGEAYRNVLYDGPTGLNAADPAIAPRASRAYEIAIALSPRQQLNRSGGDPYDVIQEIWGAVAVTHAGRGAADSARWAFQNGRIAGAYYPAILGYSRDVLATCAPDAILFVGGHRDALPLWYLQAVESLRQDVTVVNLTLLNAPWYIRQARTGHLFCNSSVATVMADADIDQLKSQRWEPHRITVPVGQGRLEWDVFPTVEGSFIRVQDLVLLDMLTANAGTRPVYFAATVAEPDLAGLRPFLQLEGLVSRLTPDGGAFNAQRLERHLTETYQFDGLSDPRLAHLTSLQRLYHHYRMAFIALVLHKQQTGDTMGSRTILARMDEVLPPSQLPYPDLRFVMRLKELETRM